MVSPNKGVNPALRRSPDCNFFSSNLMFLIIADTDNAPARTAPSITRMPPVDPPAPTSWAPRPTRVLSTPAYALSTGRASLAVNGPGAASSSRPLPVSCGRFRAGPLPQRKIWSPAQRILLHRQPTAVARRTGRMLRETPVLLTAIVVPTPRCRAHPVFMRLHRLPWPSPPRHE